MARRNDTGQPRRLPLRALVLAIACGWLLLVLSVLISPSVFAFGALPSATPASSPTPASTICTNCATPMPTNTPTTAPTSTATVSASPTATATSAGGGGGGGGGGQGGGGGGPAGPNVTRVVYSQATVGSSDNGPLQGLTPSAFGDNGLLLASTLGCVVALLGIIIAAIALMVLVRGGYGPYLKALLRGKRAGRQRGNQDNAGATPEWNDGQGMSQGPGMGYPAEAGYGPPMRRGPGYASGSGYRGGYDDAGDGYGPPPGRSASRAARPPAPNPRGRQDWR